MSDCLCSGSRTPRVPWRPRAARGLESSPKISGATHLLTPRVRSAAPAFGDGIRCAGIEVDGGFSHGQRLQSALCGRHCLDQLLPPTRLGETMGVTGNHGGSYIDGFDDVNVVAGAGWHPVWTQT
jgi:hypothetical protein